MKLEDFVSETLKQIINGVSVAQEYGATKSAMVNPISARFHSSTQGQSFCSETGVPLQNVSFDVAVTVTQEQAASNNGEQIGSISVSPTLTNSSQNSSVSRIKFDVPVLLPTSGKRR